MNEDEWMNGFNLELIAVLIFFIQSCKHSSRKLSGLKLFGSVPIAIGTAYDLLIQHLLFLN